MGRFSSDNISSFVQPNKELEPHRQYNFQLFIYDIGNGVEDLPLHVETGALPNTSFDEIELGYGNDFIYIPGKARVEPITFTFRDMIQPSTAKILWDWYTSYYTPETGNMNLVSSFKKSADLYRYTPGGALSGGWELRGIWIQSANYGTLDFNASDIIRVECNFRYDRAIAKNLGQSGGAPGPAGA